MQDPHQPHTSTPVELKALVERRDSGKPFLAWRDDSRVLRFKELTTESPPLVIGRKAPADIPLSWDSQVSAPHAQLSLLGAGWFIEDLESTNGTYVAHKRIWSRARLRDGTRITAGQTILVFHHAPIRSDESGTADTEWAESGVTREDLRENEFGVLRELCRPMISDGADEPPTNAGIADAVFLSQDTIKKNLTELYRKFGISEEPKRRRLAQRAIARGVVTLDDLR